MGDTIVLVGAASSYKQTPWNDPDLRIWGLGVHMARMPRAGRLFEIHDPALWSQYGGSEERYASRLAARNVPVVMREPHPAVPLSEPYPFDAVRDRFGPLCLHHEPGYYVSSFAYMIAAALLEDPAEIRLYGVHMSADGEYGYQKPNAEYWLGIAIGMGVRVWIHQAAPLCRTRQPYGAVGWDEAGGHAEMQRRYVRGRNHGGALAI